LSESVDLDAEKQLQYRSRAKREALIRADDDLPVLRLP